MHDTISGVGLPVPLFPWNKSLFFPCCPISKSSIPQNCLCALDLLIFRPLFPCSPEINAFLPPTPHCSLKPMRGPIYTSMISWVMHIQLGWWSCTGFNGRGRGASLFAIELYVKCCLANNSPQYVFTRDKYCIKPRVRCRLDKRRL